MRLTSPFSIKVVGVSFVDEYPDNLLMALAAADEAHSAGEGLAVVLTREPDNPHDPNAIAVHVPAAGGKVGHVPREIAARMAPELDADPQSWIAEVGSILSDPSHPERPGISISCRRNDG